MLQLCRPEDLAESVEVDRRPAAQATGSELIDPARDSAEGTAHQNGDQSPSGSASSIASWLFTIVRRECLRLVDKQRRAPANLHGEEDELPSASLDPADTAQREERTKLLADALAALDPIQREVILLRDIQEVTAPETAAQLGISIDALKSRLHRAQVNLREQMLAAPRA